MDRAVTVGLALAILEQKLQVIKGGQQDNDTAVISSSASDIA
jgi:hypothetical protein